MSDTIGGRLRGIVFDMDGVLVESEPFMMEATARMFRELGHELPRTDFKEFVGMGEDKIIAGAAAAHGIAIDLPGAKARTYEIYLELILGRLKPIAGAVEFVARMQARGLALAVASSADAIKVEGNLKALGVPASTFRTIVTGSEVAKKKPAPDIFIEAIRRIGLAPSECLVIEDAVAGVAAAKAAGAECLAITSTFSRERLAQADWIAPDFRSVPHEAIGW